MGQVSAELLFQIGSVLVTGAAIYGGIRADLKSMHSKIESVKDDAAEAHRRLDRHLEAPGRALA